MNEAPKHKPNCEGQEPTIFDFPEFAPMAIDICVGCKVRDWCLRQVDPAKNFYDGVAGGHAWHDGRVQRRWSDPDTDPIAQAYLGTRPKRRGPIPINSPKVRDFMVGKIAWNRLTIAERQEAVHRMAKQGVPQELAVNATKLPAIQVAGIYKNTTIKRTEGNR